MKRCDHWRARFDAAIDEMRLRPFDWESQHDCALGLACKVVQAVTNVDFGAAYRGRYTSKSGAYRVMRKEGFNDLGDLVASKLPEIHPSRCRIGDLALYRTDSVFGYAIGIVNGERVFVLREEGIGTMDLLRADRAFKVG